MNPNYLKQLKQDFESAKYWKKIGLTNESLIEGEAVIQISMVPENLNMSGNLHGGVMMSALDIAMGLAARSLGAKKVSTIQLEVRFIQELSEGNAYAKAKIIYRTKNTAVIEGKIIDGENNLVAFSTSTFKLFW